jgi:predicted metal-binding membrane protein
MIAMMIPSAAPTILLFGRVHRHAVTLGRNPGPPTTAFFTAGYLITWLVFSITAALIHYALDYGGMLSARTMALRSHWFAAATLIAAGLYQFSPLKNVCLSHCRAPASFLSRHWRPGSLGAIRLGALHGAYCVGCCWALMTLLFVGGVMNLIWIAVLTLSVMAEKLLPGRLWAGRLGGIALLVWGLGMLVP